MLCLVCHFIMNRLTPEQHLQIVQIYYQNNGLVRTTDPDLHKKNLFSDEAHFWLNGYVNKKNETPFHPQKVTVWCALCAEGIIFPYFFKNEAGHNVTVNGECYRAITNDFFVPELEAVDVDDLWFQQDGAEGNFW